MPPLKHWTLKEIISALQEIKKRGWIQSNRLHNTGIGKTLEDLLGIEENNIDLPDFGKLELKSHRKETSSMISLFTKKPEGITNKEILDNFGYPDKSHPEINVLHTTISKNPNSMNFFYTIDHEDEKLIFHHKDKEMGYYSFDLLKTRTSEKLGNGVILVFAKRRKTGDIEEFFYDEAYLLKDFKFDVFLEKLLYEMRMGAYKSGDKKGKPHDHGSCFRIKKSNLSDIFGVYKKII